MIRPRFLTDAIRQRRREGTPGRVTDLEVATVLLGYDDSELQEYARGVSVERLRDALREYVPPCGA